MGPEAIKEKHFSTECSVYSVKYYAMSPKRCWF